MIEPVDEDERAQLLRELLIERFGPLPRRALADAHKSAQAKRALEEEG